MSYVDRGDDHRATQFLLHSSRNPIWNLIRRVHHRSQKATRPMFPRPAMRCLSNTISNYNNNNSIVQVFALIDTTVPTERHPRRRTVRSTIRRIISLRLRPFTIIPRENPVQRRINRSARSTITDDTPIHSIELLRHRRHSPKPMKTKIPIAAFNMSN